MNGEIDREEGEVSDWESDHGNSCLEETTEVFGEDLDRLKLLAGDLGLDIQLSKDELCKLYADFGITSDSKKYFRFDAICVKGDVVFEEKQILEYLQECKPCSAYVISNSACVVVFENRLYATLSLLKFSTSVSNAMSEETDSTNVSHCRRIYIPGYGFFAVRFAKITENFVVKDVSFNADVYQQLERNYTTVQSRLFGKDKNDDGTKNPWGDLCKRWGMYDHQEVYGPELPPNQINNKSTIESNSTYSGKDFRLKTTNKSVVKRLGKRTLEVHRDEIVSDDDDDDGDDDDEHWTKRSKLPRMRMRADDEQEKKKQNSKAKHQLIIERVDAEVDLDEMNGEYDHDTRRSDIYSRLGAREGLDECEDDSCSKSSGESDNMPYRNSCIVVSRIQKVSSDNDKSNVWSRLDKCENSDVNSETDLRMRISKSKTDISSKKLDLRKKLNNQKDSRRSPLRIEIDNDYCS